MLNIDFKIDKILNDLAINQMGMSVREFLDCLNWGEWTHPKSG